MPYIYIRIYYSATQMNLFLPLGAASRVFVLNSGKYSQAAGVSSLREHRQGAIQGAPIAVSPPRTARKCSVAATSADATAPLLLPGFLPITLSVFQAPVPSRREAKASGLETKGGFLPSKKARLLLDVPFSSARGDNRRGPVYRRHVHGSSALPAALLCPSAA